MLWSLLKALAFLGVVALAALAAVFLTDSTGGVRISVADTEYTLGPSQSVAAAVLLVLALWLALKILSLLATLIRFMAGDETAISRHFTRNRERKGFQAMGESLMALASGEGREAMAKAAKAQRHLRRPELTNLLAAQAAEMAGDRKTAEEVYKRLLADDRTRFVGVRGLMKQKLDAGETETALKLAEKAFALKPRHVEVQDALLKLQAEKGDWSGARKVLDAKLRHGSLTRDVHRRRDAILALCSAGGPEDGADASKWREAAISANRLSPDLIPAAVMACRAHAVSGNAGRAARVVEKAWAASPHPELCAAYAEIHPEESPARRLDRFGKLTEARPDHPETRMLLAELNIAAERFPDARRALGDLPETAPTARSLAIMAAIERGEGGDDAVVRGWLTKALTASRGPRWICDNCDHVHGRWRPLCDSCAAFDTLSWREPPRDETPMPNGADMLPLIVGSARVEDAESGASGGGRPTAPSGKADSVDGDGLGSALGEGGGNHGDAARYSAPDDDAPDAVGPTRAAGTR